MIIGYIFGDFKTVGPVLQKLNPNPPGSAIPFYLYAFPIESLLFQDFQNSLAIGVVGNPATEIYPESHVFHVISKIKRSPSQHFFIREKIEENFSDYRYSGYTLIRSFHPYLPAR
jgi:hypothetical protein